MAFWRGKLRCIVGREASITDQLHTIVHYVFFKSRLPIRLLVNCKLTWHLVTNNLTTTRGYQSLRIKGLTKIEIFCTRAPMFSYLRDPSYLFSSSWTLEEKIRTVLGKGCIPHEIMRWYCQLDLRCEVANATLNYRFGWVAMKPICMPNSLFSTTDVEWYLSTCLASTRRKMVARDNGEGIDNSDPTHCPLNFEPWRVGQRTDIQSVKRTMMLLGYFHFWTP